MTAKRVFISYSHDSEEHKVWVKRLAEFFVENGVETLLDQWDLEFGDDLPSFMEKGITEADRVILVCTDSYGQKANAGSGGVGYEKTIVTAEMLGGPDQRRKFIPVVRNLTEKSNLPVFLGAKYYADLSDGSDQEAVKRELLHTIMGVPPTKPALGAKAFIPTDSPVDMKSPADKIDVAEGRGDPCVVFSERFGQAFPGVRGVQWFDDGEIIRERLEILLAPPLMYNSAALAWWWRGPQNMHIDRFEHTEGHHFLLGIDELNISKIAAVNLGDYYGCFVYVETKPDEPTGLYEWKEEKTRNAIEMRGYADEEYGLVDGTLPISRVEYDDGAAIIDGRPVNVQGRVELRARYVTPYNLIVAPNCSPINKSDFDYELQEGLNAILTGERMLEDLIEPIRRLPRRH